MKMEYALKIIENSRDGYVVNFSVHIGAICRLDQFPEKDEPLIESEAKAWELAQKFANSTDASTDDIFVSKIIRGRYKPAADYQDKMIKRLCSCESKSPVI
jgi:hypothetical protein